MKTAFAILAASFLSAAALASSSTVSGIAHTLLADAVTLRLEQGSWQNGGYSQGKFVAYVEYQRGGNPAAGSAVTKCTINVYKLEQAAGTAVRETKIYSSAMTKVSSSIGEESPTQRVSETFAIDASRVSNQQGSLLLPNNVYRAEVIVDRSVAGSSAVPGLEAGAADIMFWMSPATVPTLPLANVGGSLLVSASSTPKASATAAQKRALLEAEIAEFRKATDAVLSLLRKHSPAAAPGQPAKAAWSWSGGSTQQIWPPRNDTSYVIKSGQVYKSAQASVSGEFASMAKNATKTINTPNGTIRVAVTNKLTFADAR
jgi:hypothetical protein